MHAHRKNISNKGFSLVELSIVIVIVGIMLAAAINMGTAQMGAAKITDTKKKLEMISNALQLYFETNERLPCPADMAVVTGAEANFNGVNCTTANFTAASLKGGAVPTFALGLPQSFMYDGWGNKITYVIDDRASTVGNWATSAPTMAGAYCPYNVNKDTVITINDLAGNTVSTSAIYTLISHGKSGLGAWSQGGVRVAAPCPSSIYELKNGGLAAGCAGDDFDGTFYDGSINDGNVAAKYFDNIVKWQTDDMMYYCKNNHC